VVLNAVDAAMRGADIRSRTRCVGARHADGIWHLVLEGSGAAAARVLVNAAGPSVDRVLRDVVGVAAPRRVRLVKGSHIVVPRLFDHDRAYIFQNTDGRICFAVPFEQDFTLIGTTDVDYTGDPEAATSSPEEEQYLCTAVGAYLRQTIDPTTIVWRYAGVRPLLDDGASSAQEATRDYVLTLDEPPLLAVFGGKLTTYRRLAEAAMARLAPLFPGLPGAWTHAAALPGGDFPWDGLGEVAASLSRDYPFIAETTCRRLARTYGTRAAVMLGDALTEGDLGSRIGVDLTQRELDFLVRNEWARTAEDVLWRRSRLGLRFSKGETTALAQHLG